MDGVRIARAAISAAASVFGVGSDEVVKPKSVPSRLARGAAISTAFDLHQEQALTWSDVEGSMRAAGFSLCQSSLRKHRQVLGELVNAGGGFAEALRGLCDRTLATARLHCLGPSFAA